jgi:metal-responsive CopG/Arc/MetJ family transcriptional regulator
MKSVVSVSLPDDMAFELEKVANQSGQSKSGIIKEALKIYLWETRFTKLRKTLKPKAKAKGLLTDKDVFKVVS